MVGDLLRKIVHIDDGLGDARIGKTVEATIKQRASRNPDQRLRNVSVIGRMRLPRPAANTIATFGKRLTPGPR